MSGHTTERPAHWRGRMRARMYASGTQGSVTSESRVKTWLGRPAVRASAG